MCLCVGVCVHSYRNIDLTGNGAHTQTIGPLMMMMMCVSEGLQLHSQRRPLRKSGLSCGSKIKVFSFPSLKLGQSLFEMRLLQQTVVHRLLCSCDWNQGTRYFCTLFWFTPCSYKKTCSPATQFFIVFFLSGVNTSLISGCLSLQQVWFLSFFPLLSPNI